MRGKLTLSFLIRRPPRIIGQALKEWIGQALKEWLEHKYIESLVIPVESVAFISRGHEDKVKPDI